MKNILQKLPLILLFLTIRAIPVQAQAHDPHRGLTVTRFLNFTPQSIIAGYPRVAADFSILGTPREDSLLKYARI